jgi:hypothetical protein
MLSLEYPIARSIFSAQKLEKRFYYNTYLFYDERVSMISVGKGRPTIAEYRAIA